MTNELTNCPDCGASYAMVGRVHRCVPRVADELRAGKNPVTDSEPGRGTYKYRDADKWRSYMAQYMRSYRRRTK